MPICREIFVCAAYWVMMMGYTRRCGGWQKKLEEKFLIAKRAPSQPWSGMPFRLQHKGISSRSLKNVQMITPFLL